VRVSPSWLADVRVREVVLPTSEELRALGAWDDRLALGSATWTLSAVAGDDAYVSEALVSGIIEGIP
jgi:hypothetical protein